MSEERITFMAFPTSVNSQVTDTISPSTTNKKKTKATKAKKAQQTTKTKKTARAK